MTETRSQVAKRGREAEQKKNKLMGGKMQVNSGAFWFSKGDFKDDTFLFDNKSCVKNYFSLTVKMWEKLEKEAIKARRIPCLAIGFGKYDTLTNRNEYEAMVVNYLPEGVEVHLGYVAPGKSLRITELMVAELWGKEVEIVSMEIGHTCLYLVGLEEFKRLYAIPV